MPNYSTFSWTKMVETLTGLGSCMGTFSQTQFNKTPQGQDRVDSMLGQSLDGGYCAGVVTDWARRVLLSSPTRNPSFVAYKYEGVQAEAKTTRTVQRMGQAYADQVTQLPWSTPHGQDSATMREVNWNAHVTRVGQAQPKQKRPFQSLQTLGSKQAVYDTPDRWVAALVGGSTAGSPISAGCVAKLGFSDPGEVGHAVAIWRRRENTAQGDSYYFFDPNFGVFAYSIQGVEKALRVLFAHPHPNLKGDAKNIPYYNDCARYAATQMSYIILGPVNRVDAVVMGQVQAPQTTAPVQAQQTAQPQALPTVQTSQPIVQPVQQPIQQPVFQPPNPSPQPANLYGGAALGLPVPGNTLAGPTTSVSTSTSGDLTKGELEAVYLDAGRYTQAFMGKSGGYIKLDAGLAEKIRKAAPGVWKSKGYQWKGDEVVEQPAGQFRHAMLKTTVKRLIDWL